MSGYIFFDKICRTCLHSYGVKSSYLVNNTDSYLKMTEHECAEVLEKALKNGNVKCDFCGSSNMECSKIEINDYILYNYNRIKENCKTNNYELLELGIIKYYGKFQINIGCNENQSELFLKECIKQIIHTIIELPDERWLSDKNIGNFQICITGNIDKTNGKVNSQIQRLSCTGLNRKEIKTWIVEYLNRKEYYDLLVYIYKQQII